MYTDLQLREVFHFCFLERLIKLTDPGLYALKGGVNLRFYFNSPRYSEDMDLDVFAGSVETLKKNGYKILNDASFQRSLRVFGIEELEINDPSKAKHTNITQRFRVGLLTQAGLRLPTKVEFSRRKKQAPHLQTDLIIPEVARQYRRLSFRCQHYPGEVAVLQKIAALYGRQTTQARDVYDLGVLFAGGFVTQDEIKNNFTAQQLQLASECVTSLGFSEFSGQVLEFLPDDERKQYDTLTEWEQLQKTVLDFLFFPKA